MLKQCSKCKELKEDFEFYKSSQSKDGLFSFCKSCTKIQQQKYREGNREALLAKARIYDAKHKNMHRNAQLKGRYGFSLEEHDIMLEEQNGCCAICQRSIANLPRPPSVDHDHETGKVRGLLCQSCNSGLANFKDNIESLKFAIEYLIRSRHG